MYLPLSQNKLKKALSSYKGDWTKVEFATHNKGGHVGFTDTNDRVSLNLDTCPHAFLEHLLKYGALTESARARIISETGIGGEQIGFDRVLTSPLDLYNMIATLGTKTRNAEMWMCGHWYPITLYAEYTVDDDPYGRHLKQCAIRATLSFCGQEYYENWTVTELDFRDSEGMLEWSGEDLFQRFGLRRLQSDVQAFDQRVDRALRLSEETGMVVDCIGLATMFATVHYAQRRGNLEFGTEETPKKVIIDRTLETDTRSISVRKDQKRIPDRLPVVRVFHLEMKRWGYVDELELLPHVFDTNAMSKLVISPAMEKVLKQLFHVHAHDLFGDVLKEKHGGLIMLANGSSGVGKTLTAEIFAEVSGRPLYVLEMVELGADVKGIEEALQRVFTRVTRWNAVLLMDECDVFLSTRGTDLIQNILVGIFLRLMDYYKGLLFLTSNRAEVIDKAFKSRITLQLDYPELDAKARYAIWRIMFTEAHMSVPKQPTLDKLAQHVLNGRQIRNLVRLMRAMHGTTITYAQMESIIAFACH